MKTIKKHSITPPPKKTSLMHSSIAVLCGSVGLALAAFPQEAHAGTTLWATDVSKVSGWTDNDQFLNHCWATSSSQVINWWQTQVAKKWVLPEDAITSVDGLRDYYTGYGYKGRYADSAILEYLATLDENFTSPLDDNDTSYDSREEISQILWDNLSLGAAGVLSATFWGGSSHAVTLWGAEFDENNLVTKIYVTDSAASGSGDFENGQSYANGIEVYDYDTGNSGFVQTITVQNAGYTSTVQSRIDKIFALDFLRYQDEYLVDSNGLPVFALIPEPSAFGAFAGTLALTLALSRRKRRK